MTQDRAKTAGKATTTSQVDYRAETAERCHEIQVCLGRTDVPEFESLLEIGMAVRLALHLRGLPLVQYEVVRLVSGHYLDIAPMAVQRVVHLLAEVEFVKLQSEGKTIRAVLPTVPYYEDLYATLGGFAATWLRKAKNGGLESSEANRWRKTPSRWLSRIH